MSKAKSSGKVKQIVGYSALGVFIAFVLYVIICFITGNMFSVFGYGFSNVLTDSMEPVIDARSIVIVDLIDEDEISSLVADPENGSIIVFKGKVGGQDAMIIHRLVRIDEDGKYVTKGDNASGEDPAFDSSKVVGTYVRKAPVLTAISRALSSPWSFMLVLFLPCLGLVICHMISISKSAILMKLEKEREEQDTRLEELKRKAVEDFIKSTAIAEVSTENTAVNSDTPSETLDAPLETATKTTEDGPNELDKNANSIDSEN